MDLLIDGSLGAGTLALVALGLLFALGFEFANGFHDTANAVATVIYTHTLLPTAAVIWSGLWNFIGVLVSSGAVAFGIVNLPPADLVAGAGTGARSGASFAWCSPCWARRSCGTSAPGISACRPRARTP